MKLGDSVTEEVKTAAGREGDGEEKGTSDSP